MPLSENQQKILSRLWHIAEFAPCTITEFDYELQEKGYVKIDTKYQCVELTRAGINKAKRLQDELRT